MYLFVQVETVSPPSWEQFDDEQVAALLQQCQVGIWLEAVTTDHSDYHLIID